MRWQTEQPEETIKTAQRSLESGKTTSIGAW